MKKRITMLLFHQIVQIAISTSNVSASFQEHTAPSRSLSDIDSIIARDPTLVFNIPEAVTDDDEPLVLQDDFSVPMPFVSEPDFVAGFRRWDNDEVNQKRKGKTQDLQGSRLKQARREQVSAWLVNKRNIEGQKPSSSPSPSPKPSGGRTDIVLFDGAVEAKTSKISTPLPFDLHLFGRSFGAAEIFVSPSGYIRLSDEGDFSGQDTLLPKDLPVSALGTYLIFPYWSDINYKSLSFVDYTFTASAVTFDWKVTASPASSSKGLCHFQLTFSTAKTDYVEFAYMEDSNAGCFNDESATIGVQSDDGAYQLPTVKKDSITPGLKIVFNTVTGDVDLYYSQRSSPETDVANFSISTG